MSDKTNNNASEDPNVLYSHTCKLARSTKENELASLRTSLTNTALLAKLDSTEAYEGPAVHLRVAGVMQILAENSSPLAWNILIELTNSPAFLEHRARVELLIQALVPIKPAPREAVDFWERHFQPEDGYSSVTVWALLDNGSEPAIALFEKKMLDSMFPETEREYWLTAVVLQHRNDLPLLQACDRMLDSSLEEPYRLLLVDVLFDYKPDDWYGARYWYKPPPRNDATPDALEQLRALAQKALETQPLAKSRQEKVNQLIQDIDKIMHEKNL